MTGERNTIVFDVNVYDEEQTGKERVVPKFARAKAVAKWKEVCATANPRLISFFSKKHDSPSPWNADNEFSSGKYWQMLDLLDGNYLLRDVKLTERAKIGERASYQDAVLSHLLLGDNAQVLQTGWDLTVNAALLSEMMPTPRNRGAAYILEHVVWDHNSLLYPSVTNKFAARLANDAFWQIALNMTDGGEGTNFRVLEGILTRDFGRLTPYGVADQLKRWTAKTPLGVVAGPLVIGDAGPESFSGLSSRALENYGRFLGEVIDKNEYLQVGGSGRRLISPLVREYHEAVNCKDEDGNDFLRGERKEELSALRL